jgi:oxalate decarboxylase
MRLTAGSFRELHWHTADEWAIMLYGTARVTVLNPDGTIFIDDVGKNDLWYFPAGYPHSIQGLEPDGCEFLLVFDEGLFSEDNTFLLSEWIAHTPKEVLSKNFHLDPAKMGSMAPTILNSGGETRVVDSRNFPAAKNIAGAMLTIKPGCIRELHWHPNASE